jgi:sugar lactone lactonase YvrE
VYKIAATARSHACRERARSRSRNGIALDKGGNVYVTDTIGGAVWRVPADGGAATKWFESPLLLGDGSFNFGFPLGANGSPIDRTSSS